MDEYEWDDSDCLTDGGEDKGGDATVVVDKPEAKDADGNAKEAKDEKTVPLSALEDERSKRQSLELRTQNAEQNVQTLTDHINTLQNIAPAEKESSSGIGDDDVITGRELKVIMAQVKDDVEKTHLESDTKTMAVMAELSVKADHSDYNEVINTNLVNVFNADPSLRVAIAGAKPEHRPLIAYKLGITDSAYIKQANDKTVVDIKDRLKENAEKPGSVNVAGGAADNTDLAKVIANESREDFAARVERVKAKAAA